MKKEPKGAAFWFIDDETEKWCIKEDAPDWAKKEFDDFFGLVNAKADDNDVVTKY